MEPGSSPPCHPRERGDPESWRGQVSRIAAREFSAAVLRPTTPWMPACAGMTTLGVTPQSGFARKPLKSPDSRKKEAWISLPPALNFLPNDLDFPSPGFANPSPHFGKSARRPFSAREAPAVLRCVNAVGPPAPAPFPGGLFAAAIRPLSSPRLSPHQVRDLRFAKRRRTDALPTGPAAISAAGRRR